MWYGKTENICVFTYTWFVKIFFRPYLKASFHFWSQWSEPPRAPLLPAPSENWDSEEKQREDRPWREEAGCISYLLSWLFARFFFFYLRVFTRLNESTTGVQFICWKNVLNIQNIETFIDSLTADG